MRVDDALRLARELMDANGLAHWGVELDRARRRAGSCRYEARVLTLSRPLTELYEESRVREVLLHEIAHALCGPDHGHDAVWRATALSLGSTGARTVAPDAPRPPAPWRGTCAAGHVAERFRRPPAPMSCGRCSRSFDPAHMLTWTHLGEPVDVEAHYASRSRRSPRRRRRTTQEARWRTP